VASRVVVGDEAFIGGAAKVLEDVGEGEVSAEERGHIGEEEVVPAKEAVAAILLVPEAADRGDDPIESRLVNQVPGDACLDSDICLGEVAVCRRCLLHRFAGVFDQLANLVDRPWRAGGKSDRLLEGQDEIGSLGLDVEVLLVSGRGVDIDGASRQGRPELVVRDLGE
jgi:hypothetical protein